MDNQTILVVDDDHHALRLMKRIFEDHDYVVLAANSGRTALDLIRRHGLPHLLVVDLHMPGMSGLELCNHVLAYSDIPVVMVTADDDPETVIAAIDKYVDDYIRKPFEPMELYVRVKRVLSRSGRGSHAFGLSVQIDDWLQINIQDKKVVTKNWEKDLTDYEAKILHILLSFSGQFITPQFIKQRIWHDENHPDTLKVLIHRIRQKIEKFPKSPRYILSERGAGYKFAIKPK